MVLTYGGSISSPPGLKIHPAQKFASKFFSKDFGIRRNDEPVENRRLFQTAPEARRKEKGLELPII
jgi:hypothetical protein